MARESDEFDNPEWARCMLQIEEAVTLRRRAAAAWLTAHSEALPALPIRPSPVELAVLKALARTYGRSLLKLSSFAPVIDCIADRGAVLLVQRILWGERPEDRRFALQLVEARNRFERLCDTWSQVFMADARAVFARCASPRFAPKATVTQQNDL